MHKHFENYYIDYFSPSKDLSNIGNTDSKRTERVQVRKSLKMPYYYNSLRTHFKLVELISGNMCCQPENIISLKL